MGLKIGVLAMQGAFAKHCQMLDKLHIHTIEVRTPEHLQLCDALIIPGGESTTILKQIKRSQLFEVIQNFSKPIYGTCAGMILLAKAVENDEMPTLGLIDIAVERNAYGRQVESFFTTLAPLWEKSPLSIDAFFIRAPKIRKILSHRVSVLAKYHDQPVFVKQGDCFASSFHPELTQDSTIHQYFVDYVLQFKCTQEKDRIHLCHQ